MTDPKEGDPVPDGVALCLRIPELGKLVDDEGHLRAGAIRKQGDQSVNDLRYSDLVSVLSEERPLEGIGYLCSENARLFLRGDSPSIHESMAVSNPLEGNLSHAEIRAFVDGKRKKKLPRSVGAEYARLLAERVVVIKHPGVPLDGWVSPDLNCQEDGAGT